MFSSSLPHPKYLGVILRVPTWILAGCKEEAAGSSFYSSDTSCKALLDLQFPLSTLHKFPHQLFAALQSASSLSPGQVPIIRSLQISPPTVFACNPPIYFLTVSWTGSHYPLFTNVPTSGLCLQPSSLLPCCLLDRFPLSNLPLFAALQSASLLSPAQFVSPRYPPPVSVTLVTHLILLPALHPAFLLVFALQPASGPTSCEHSPLQGTNIEFLL